MKISLVAAVAMNRAIGFENKLIYWLPDDMKHFRQLTTGHTVVMGRRTFESLPKGALPNRRNCVLSRTVSKLPGCECFASWSDFRDSCSREEEVYVIGGASLYSETIDEADRLCLTKVFDIPKEADTFFPEYELEWEEVSFERHSADERHSHPFAFVEYRKMLF